MDVPQRPSGDDEQSLPIEMPPVVVRPPIERPPLRYPISSEPAFAVSPSVLQRYNARVLDPATAVRVAGQAPIRPTVYLADKLLVSGVAGEDTRDALTEAARSKGLTLVPPVEHAALREQLVSSAREAGRDDAEKMVATLVHLEPVEGAAAVPDAWDVLQTFRAAVGRDHPGQQHVALDHLVTATRHIEGSPADPSRGGPGNTYASYGLPGFGGRMPVNWIGSAPARREKMPCRRPVVAVLDTGVGKHPWWPEDAGDAIVLRNQHVGQLQLGLQTTFDDPEDTGVVTDPLEGALDSDSGHGTFIAGLIHQLCPDADILSVRVMPSDGAVPEHTLLNALTTLVVRQHVAQLAGDASGIVDVVSLSLGYYHEQPDDAAFDPLLCQPLDALARMGVAVVASAGNEATARPMYPAAFTPHLGGEVTSFDTDCVPLMSVGALNPNGTIAMFSNAGNWVACHRAGAGLVSTFPVTFNASAQAGFDVDSPAGTRATIDPDDFSSGFGTWSGTSFAAPILAGELAQSLVDGSGGAIDAVDAASMVSRGWAAVTACTKAARP